MIDDDDDCGAVGGMNEWQEKPKDSKEISPGGALSITHATSPDTGSSPGRLSHCTA
jgi:hypothetical protein